MADVFFQEIAPYVQDFVIAHPVSATIDQSTLDIFTSASKYEQTRDMGRCDGLYILQRKDVHKV